MNIVSNVNFKRRQNISRSDDRAHVGSGKEAQSKVRGIDTEASCKTDGDAAALERGGFRAGRRHSVDGRKSGDGVHGSGGDRHRRALQRSAQIVNGDR